MISMVSYRSAIRNTFCRCRLLKHNVLDCRCQIAQFSLIELFVASWIAHFEHDHTSSWSMVCFACELHFYYLNTCVLVLCKRYERCIIMRRSEWYCYTRRQIVWLCAPPHYSQVSRVSSAVPEVIYPCFIKFDPMECLCSFCSWSV